MRVQRTIRVSRPLPAVAAYLADFGNTVHWDPGTLSCIRIDRGPVTVGSRWRNVSVFNGRTTELDYRLERLEPDRLTFVGRNDRARTTDDLRLARDGDGTRIVYAAEITFHGLLRLVTPVLRRSFERLADEVETALAAEVERV